MADLPQSMETAQVEGTQNGASAGGMPDAVRAAVDALVGESAPAAAGSTKPVEDAPAPADAEPTVEDKATGADKDAELAEFRAFAKAQQHWGQEKQRLTAQAQTARDEAKREILSALDSEDPDGELERLGVPQESRRALVKKMILRHVPADKTDPALRDQIEKDNLRAEVRKIGQRFENYVKEQTEARERERQEAVQVKAANEALQTLEDACRNAGDDLKLVRARYGKRRDVVITDAIRIGKELATKGQISSRSTMAENARKIVKALNDEYRGDFGLDDGAAAAAPPTTAQARPNPPKNGADASAPRTLTRGPTAVTRPPDPAPATLSEDEWFKEEAAQLAKLKRDGKLGAS